MTLHNAAGRVSLLAQSASKGQENKPALAIWSETFSVTQARLLDERTDTARLLSNLIEESSAVQRQMATANVLSPHLYTFAFENLSRSMNIAGLGTRWAEYKRFLDKDTLRILEVCSELLPLEEDDFSLSSLETLEQELGRFAEQVNSKTEEGILKDFVQRQISRMELTFLEYRIVGRRTFSDAAFSFANDADDNSELIKEHAETEEIKGMAELGKRFIEMSPKVAAMIQIAQEASSGASTLLKIGGQVLGG